MVKKEIGQDQESENVDIDLINDEVKAKLLKAKALAKDKLKDKWLKIKMLRDITGSPDGVRIEHYEKDKEYEVPYRLAKDFESTGAIERLRAEEGDKFILGEKVEGTEYEGGDDSHVLNEPVGGDKEKEAKPFSSKSIKGAPKNKAAKPEEDK